ncbi:hypothetical protein PENSPDRAFT_1658 [Peniophora sp. CONT]|nr:hypothetical protein PENSPDRAFT_1658 [Peniophora sp. CONT]
MRWCVCFAQDRPAQPLRSSGTGAMQRWRRWLTQYLAGSLSLIYPAVASVRDKMLRCQTHRVQMQPLLVRRRDARKLYVYMHLLSWHPRPSSRALAPAASGSRRVHSGMK